MPMTSQHCLVGATCLEGVHYSTRLHDNLHTSSMFTAGWEKSYALKSVPLKKTNLKASTRTSGLAGCGGLILQGFISGIIS